MNAPNGIIVHRARLGYNRRALNISKFVGACLLRLDTAEVGERLCFVVAVLAWR